MIHPSVENLATIRVVYLAPDTLTLCGIPYEMRPGQNPSHLWRASRRPAPPTTAAAWEHAARYPHNDWTDAWIYLGEPGWYCTMTREQITLAKAFEAKLKASDLMPGYPHEWSRIPAGFFEIDTPKLAELLAS